MTAACRWHCHDEIARGTQSQLFHATDKSGEYQGEFVLKRMTSEDGDKRLHNEVRALTLLKHPNIIPLVDSSLHYTITESRREHRPSPQRRLGPHLVAAGENKWDASLRWHDACGKEGPAVARDDGQTAEGYIVTPYAKDGNLSDPRRLAQCCRNIEYTLSIARPMAEALAFAHAHEIVHRDVSLENILFNGDQIWLCDFGICLFRVEARDGQSVEIVKPRAFAQDVYGLGKVIYAMLTGGQKPTVMHKLDDDFVMTFSKTEQGRSLLALLPRMICPVAQRIQTMEEVLDKMP